MVSSTRIQTVRECEVQIGVSFRSDPRWTCRLSVYFSRHGHSSQREVLPSCIPPYRERRLQLGIVVTLLGSELRGFYRIEVQVPMIPPQFLLFSINSYKGTFILLTYDNSLFFVQSLIYDQLRWMHLIQIRIFPDLTVFLQLSMETLHPWKWKTEFIKI